MLTIAASGSGRQMENAEAADVSLNFNPPQSEEKYQIVNPVMALCNYGETCIRDRPAVGASYL